MALVIPDGYAQVLMNIKCAGDADPYVVTWGCQVDPAADLDLLLGVIKAQTLDEIKPLFDASYTIGPFTMRVPAEADTVETYTTTGVTAGTGTTSVNLPPNCAVLVHKRTNRGGRSGRGRLYMPGVTGEEVNEVGELSTDYFDDYQAAVTAWLDALDDETGYAPQEAPGMWLLHDEATPGSPAPTKIRSLQVDRVIATQRRRLRK